MRLRVQVPEIDFDALRQGKRRALAKAITLIESTNPTHRREAVALLERCLPHSGSSLRIGISGVPGVGKSTFIEAFGLFLIGLGKRVGVLAVDPSSPLHGGSILGDKTRMEKLSREESAFVRPSPAGRSLGGVANRTREAILVAESAGHAIQSLVINYHLPIINGIVVTDDLATAQERITGSLDRGREFAHAALEMASFRQKWI